MIDLLKKWLNGTANAADEQALDRAASKDAFLGDALEGYRSMPDADHEANIAKLKAQLRGQNNKRRVGVVWWRMAAAAAMVGVVVTWFFISQQSPTTEIASNATPTEKLEDEALNKAQSPLPQATDVLVEERELVVQESEPPLSSELSQSAENEVIGESKKDKPQVKNQAPLAYEASVNEQVADVEVAEDEAIAPPVIASSATTVITDTGALEAAEVAYNDALIDSSDIVVLDAVEVEADVAYQVKEKAEVVVEEEAPKAFDAPVAKKRKRAQTSASSTQSKVRPEQEVLTLRGKILDGESEEELIGANVIIQGTNDGTITDFDGAFELQSSKPLPWRLEISYTGYTSQEALVESVGDELVLRLEDGGALLEEVVVTGYSGRPQVAPIDPRPKGGWKKFNKYIDENIQYPSSARINRIEGTVKVSFYINGKGRPEQIKIVESLCDPCDLEAIRLVEEGPKWRPRKRNTIASIKFEL